MDRRHQERFELHAAARFFWTDAAGVRCKGRGLTRDISETGVFVQTTDCPPSGSVVRLELRASALSTSGLMLQTRGQVVRVELTGNSRAAAGFAAATRSLKLRDFKTVVTKHDAQYRPAPHAGSNSWSDHSHKPN